MARSKSDTLEFLPDADEIEKTPIFNGAPVILYFLVILLVFFFVWASISEVDKVVTAHGQLVTPYPNIVIQPIETAQIESIRVRVGELVRKGQVLATIDPTVITADLNQLQAEFDNLDAQIGRLEAELAGKEYYPNTTKSQILQAGLGNERLANFQARLTRENETVERVKASIESNLHNIASLQDRVKTLSQIEAMNENLSNQQFVSRKILLESREKRQEVERDLGAARYKRAELDRELAEAEAQRTAFKKEWRQTILEQLLASQTQREAIAEELQKTRRRSNLITITAPEDAVVLELAKRSTGSTVIQGETLFSLVPINTPLEVEVQIEAKDVGYVKLHDAARLKIDAFPFQRHGVVRGELARLSRDAFLRSDERENQMNAFYIGRINIGKIELKNLDKPMRLLPGMSLSAEIAVGKHTVLSYLLDPIIKDLDEAIHEP